jgi:FkbM family methyltransferase
MPGTNHPAPGASHGAQTAAAAGASSARAPPIKTVRFQSNGRRFGFEYPDSGNMAAHLQKIFAGTEYPLLPLRGYAPRLIVDVGANIGATAVFFALNYPSAKLLCYEPARENAVFLERNVAPFPQVETRTCGLAAEAAAARLYHGNSQSMQHSLYRSSETTAHYETIELRAAGIELAEIPDGSILKLDTEGAEVPILRALAGRMSALDMIYLEYHSEEDRRAIEAMLAADFVLASSHASWPHRGSNQYVARRLTARFPELDQLRIASAP